MTQASKQWLIGVVALAQVCMGCDEERAMSDEPVDFLTVGPAYSVVEQGEAVQLHATMTDAEGVTRIVTEAATWTSSNEEVATVNRGMVTGVSSGTSRIDASYRDITRSVTVTVTPTLERIELVPHAATTASQAQAVMRAVGIFVDGTKRDLTDEATWISLDPSIARVAGAGRFTGIRPGAVQINAVRGGVGAAPQVLTVEDASLDSLSIDVPSLVLPVGQDMRLGVTGSFDAGEVERVQDLGALVTWELAAQEEPVARLSRNGVLTGLNPGTAAVTARWRQGEIERSASIDIEIRQYRLVAIAIQHRGEEAPATLGLPLAGEPERLAVLGTFEAEGGETLTWDITGGVTWQRNAGTSAFMLGSLVKTHAPGTTTFEATINVEGADGQPETLRDELSVEVVDAPLQRIEITPRDQQEPAPDSARQPLAATGRFAGDGGEVTQDLTAAVIWEVEDAEDVIIDNIGPEVGVAQILARPAPGEQAATVTIRARYRGGEGTYTLSVPPSAGE